MDAAPSSLQSHCSSNRFLHAYIPHTSPQVNGVAPLAPPVSHVTRRSAVSRRRRGGGVALLAPSAARDGNSSSAGGHLCVQSD